MERVEGVDSTHATLAKELDRKAVGTMVHTSFAAEFAVVIGGYSSALESDKFFEE